MSDSAPLPLSNPECNAGVPKRRHAPRYMPPIVVAYRSTDESIQRFVEVGLAIADALPPCCPDRGFTYMVEGGGLIKIGHTTDIRNRLTSLQAASPVPLELVALGRSVFAERYLHLRFERDRRHGEWFTAGPVMDWLRRKPDHLCVWCFDKSGAE